MQIGKFWKRLMARIPSDLPRTAQEMDAFVSAVLNTYSLPETSDYKRAIVKAIHGLSQASHRAPKHFFYAHMCRFEVMRAAVMKVTEIEKIEKQAVTPKPESPPESQVENQGI